MHSLVTSTWTRLPLMALPPTWVTWTGFSGAEMMGFFGVPLGDGDASIGRAGGVEVDVVAFSLFPLP
jgi:hypothetical protein